MQRYEYCQPELRELEWVRAVVRATEAHLMLLCLEKELEDIDRVAETKSLLLCPYFQCMFAS